MASVIDTEVIAQLKEILGDDLSLVLDSFISESDGIEKDLREGMSSGNLDVVKQASHSMKSMAGNVGAMKLSELSDQIQVKAANQDAGGVAELIPEFDEQLQLARTEINSLKS